LLVQQFLIAPSHRGQSSNGDLQPSLCGITYSKIDRLMCKILNVRSSGISAIMLRRMRKSALLSTTHRSAIAAAAFGGKAAALLFRCAAAFDPKRRSPQRRR
jgi:hypothetical protein